MARIRSVKPELRRDLTVAEWPREVRYAWVLLFGYLDDYGRGIDDLRLLVADLFPLDRDVTERKLNGWLDMMTRAGLHGDPPLCRYEVAGRRYLHAPKWGRSQKVSHPLDSRMPPCPTHDEGRKPSTPIPEPIPNETGTDPLPFRTSRAPADLGIKGTGSKGSRGDRATPAAPSTEVAVAAESNAGTVVAAYVDAVKAAGQILDQRARGRIARDTAGLIAEGAPVDLLIAAAQRLGANGYADLGAEARRLRAEQTGGGSVTRIARSPADERVAQAQALHAVFPHHEEPA